ncbi:hypothetical protein CCP3SC15_1700001 [Gammaproteobacteria bacterium]
MGLRHNQLAFLAHGHLTHRIESWAAAGATHGVVYRYPLLDRELVEFCLGVPPGQYILGGMQRSLYRRALAGRVPDEVRLVDKLPESHRVRRLTQVVDAAVPRLAELAREVEPPPLFDWLDYGALRRLLASSPPPPPPGTIGPLRNFAHRQAARIALLSGRWRTS